MNKRLTLLFWLFALAMIGGLSAAAQEEILLRITRLDTSDFPLIRVNLITADFQSAPLVDLSALSLRENGIPIGGLEFADVDIGVDVIFVIDENSTIQEIDDESGLSRLAKVQESISRFASRFMGEGDLVSIIVPDEDGVSGRFLVEDVADSAAVVDAIENYSSESLNPPPLNEMMLLALAHAADNQGDGRFQAVLLFTDGAQIHRQLPFATLVEQAQTISLPVFAAVLGARADPNEIENVAQLYQPTQATYAHMPDASGTDPIYSIWQQQGNQTQISYQSLQRSSGRYPVTINIGTSRATAELDLKIVAPEVSFESEGEIVRRVGNDPDSPLASLVPSSYSMRVFVRWPEGLPRRLMVVNLLLNGQVQSVPISLELDADNALALDLNIIDLDEGSYELVVQVTDDLGSSAESRPFNLTIETERPLPPTPTAVPTTIPKIVEAPPAPPPDRNLELLLLAVIGLVITLLLLLRRRRAKAEKEALSDEDEAPSDVLELPSEPVAAVPQLAFIELIDESPTSEVRLPIEGNNVTIGRDEEIVQVVLTDKSVAQLHARIKRRDGRYWLYDEGSANGTFHNYTRLGLTPQLLQDQDTIHFGRMEFRFLLKQVDK